MKIDRDAKIGGQPAKLVRDLLANATNFDGFYSDLVDEHLLKAWWRSSIDALIESGKIDRHNRGQALRNWTWAQDREKIFGVRLPKAPDLSARARNLIEALLAHDLIREEDRNSDGRIVYRVTDKGHATGMKTLVPRMTRATAEDLLQKTLERIAKINIDPELLHYVTEVRVFGSYLIDTNDLGDLDLAIKLERRRVKGQWAKACHDLADKSGKTLSLVERLTYPGTEIRRRIKGRLRRISLHETSELDENPQMGGRTVYRFAAPDRSDKQ
jgi:predicted nucleotidyltransferase